LCNPFERDQKIANWWLGLN
jgi:hypothetical protein